MEICVGGSRFDDIKSHAYWHNVHLDTSYKVNADNTEDTINHINDCIENPTIGLIARRRALGNGPHFVNYFCNKKRMFNFKDVAQINDVFESKYKKMYPKTGKLRKLLIENQRVNFHDVMPKMSSLKKIFYKMKSFC